MKKLLIILSISGLFACGNSDNTKGKENNDVDSTTNTEVAEEDLADVQTGKDFQGTIVYTNTCSGNPDAVAAFKTMAPSQYAISVMGNSMRVKDIGGLIGVNLILNFEDSIYYQIEDLTKKYFSVFRQTKEFPKIRLKNTGEITHIQGHQCTKYAVISSPFVNEVTKQYLWVTEDFTFPYEQGRYVGQEGYDGILPPMVISDIGFGTILKMEMTDPQTTVTMEATLIETETLAENFEIPKGYKLQKDNTNLIE